MAAKKSRKSAKMTSLKSKRLNAEQAEQVKGGLWASTRVAMKEGSLTQQASALRGISDKH